MMTIHTEVCKIIPASLKIPAHSAARQLDQPCTAQSSNFGKAWLNSQNLAGTILRLGCVIPSWLLPLVVGEYTQPSAHLFVHPFSGSCARFALLFGNFTGSPDCNGKYFLSVAFLNLI